MDVPLKQRLIGAVVLVALAVIFLPMLVQGPAPDSGVADVPLAVPDAPEQGMVTRDLPLVVPDAPPEGGATGMPAGAAPDDGAAGGPPSGAGDASVSTPAGEAAAATAAPLPPDDNPDAAELASAPPAATPPAPAATGPGTALPARHAGGDYAVGFGSFTTEGAAEKIIASLKAAGLPGYREPATVEGKAVQRVRIGPYATRADAEVARQHALRVRDDVAAQVVVLDAEPAATPAKAPTAAPRPAPGSTASAAPARPAPPAASSVGFAVQVGAFSKASDAAALRDRLRGLGFSAFTESVATDKGTLTRVRVGPVVTRAEADRLRAQVQAKAGIDGIVRPHP